MIAAAIIAAEIGFWALARCGAGGGWFAQLGLIAGLWLLFGPAWTAAAQHFRPATRPHTEAR